LLPRRGFRARWGGRALLLDVVEEWFRVGTTDVVFGFILQLSSSSKILSLLYTPPLPISQPSYLPLPSVPENFPGCIWLLTPTSSGVPPQRAVSSPKRVSIVSAWPETDTHRREQILLLIWNTRVYRRSGCAKAALTFIDQSSSRWGMTRLLGMCDRHHKGKRSECHHSAEYLSSCQC
jgi:hypothetical protein